MSAHNESTIENGNHNNIFQNLSANGDITINIDSNGKTEPKTIKTYNFPAKPKSFFGRDKKMEELHSLLTTQDEPLVLVNGVGGIGKTTIAKSI